MFRNLYRADLFSAEELEDLRRALLTNLIRENWTKHTRKRSAHAGVEGFISGHSLRVGSAVSLAQAGATVVDMQVAGRWKSSQMPAHYHFFQNSVSF